MNTMETTMYKSEFGLCGHAFSSGKIASSTQHPKYIIFSSKMLKVVVPLVCFTAALAVPAFDGNLNEHWELFKNKHGKMYSSAEEENLRRIIWEGHVSYISKHNREYDLGLHTYTVGLNEFADKSNEEFVAMMNGYTGRRTTSGTTFVAPSHTALPDSVDWRKEGYVTSVKNQGNCGSCWAFSTTGSLEGQHFKSTGKLVSLSEQNLIDCSKKQGNKGCKGGLMDNAFEYIKQNGGIDTEASYPYKGRNGKCHYEETDKGATDTGYVDVDQTEDALKSAVATVGPIAVAIDASHMSFQLYSGGVYNERRCSSTKLDHGVLAVGYGTDSESGKDYWLVKNSWGESWGMDGYIWMSRNKNNQCGIASSASYPLV